MQDITNDHQIIQTSNQNPKLFGRTSADSIVFGVAVGSGPQSNETLAGFGAGVGEVWGLSVCFSMVTDFAEDPCLDVRCGRREDATK